MRRIAYSLLLVVAVLSLGDPSLAGEISRKYAGITGLMALAAKAKYEGKGEIAWGEYARAYGLLTEIQDQKPGWNKVTVASSIERCRQEMDALSPAYVARGQDLIRRQRRTLKSLAKASLQAKAMAKLVNESRDVLKGAGIKKQEVVVVGQKGSAEGSLDSDGDGLTDAQELKLGANPFNSDTDGDGLTDYQEVNTYGTSPTLADTDRDGLSDGFEVLDFGTNPLNTDTDADGLSDEQERIWGTGPNNPDTDGDGDTDGEEVSAGYNPLIHIDESWD